MIHSQEAKMHNCDVDSNVLDDHINAMYVAMEALYNCTSDHYSPLKIFYRFMFRMTDLKYLNMLLGEIDVDRLSVVAIIGLCRPSCNFRKQCPNWYAVYEKCWNRLDFLEQQTKEQFVGLLTPQEYNMELTEDNK